jgi:hypothetical protein
MGRHPGQARSVAVELQEVESSNDSGLLRAAGLHMRALLQFIPRRPLPPYGAIEVPAAVRAFVGVLGLVHGASGCQVWNEQAGQVVSDLCGSCV